MLTNEYLYGTEVEVPEIPAELIVRRLELLNDNLELLLEVDYRVRDNERVAKVIDAIKFWETLNVK